MYWMIPPLVVLVITTLAYLLITATTRNKPLTRRYLFKKLRKGTSTILLASLFSATGAVTVYLSHEGLLKEIGIYDVIEIFFGSARGESLYIVIAIIVLTVMCTTVYMPLWLIRVLAVIRFCVNRTTFRRIIVRDILHEISSEITYLITEGSGVDEDGISRLVNYFDRVKLHEDPEGILEVAVDMYNTDGLRII